MYIAHLLWEAGSGSVCWWRTWRWRHARAMTHRHCQSVQLAPAGACASWRAQTRDTLRTSSHANNSLQLTINKIVYKIFGAMSKDLYIEISAHFGTESVENLIADRRNRFINRYGETDNYLCQMLSWLIHLSDCIFYLLRLFIYLNV